LRTLGLVFIFFYCLNFLPAACFAQSTLSTLPPQRLISEAEGHLNASRFSLAQELYDQYLGSGVSLPQRPDAHLGGIIASVKLFRGDVDDRYQKFKLEFHNHLLLLYAQAELGAHSFQQKKYDQTILWLEGIDFSVFERQKREYLRFQLGYAYFSQKDFEKAAPLLAMVKVSNSPYKAAAAYYSAYIQYKAGRYEGALNDLNAIYKDPAYTKVVPLMRMQIYYQQKMFQEIISISEQTTNEKWTDEQLTMLGDANYFLRQHEKAEKFYSDILSQKTSFKSPELLYRIGDNHLQLKQPASAIKAFKLIPPSADSLYTIASYQIGMGYLGLGDENLALAPLTIAASKSVDTKIQSLALKELLSLYMNKSDYHEAIKTGKKILNLPQTNRKERETTSELVSEAYLRTQNLDEAISHIKESGLSSAISRQTYQEATLQKGIAHYNSDQTDTAIYFLKESLRFPVVAEITAQTHFTLAECYARRSDLEEALKSYQSIRSVNGYQGFVVYPMSLYGLGFIAYQKGDYLKASQYFEEYVQSARSGIISEPMSDAELRLADCYYITKKYDQALESYKKSLPKNVKETDYILFQTACIHFAKSEYALANSLFEQIKQKHAGSIYVDDAIYQQAQMELENSNYAVAINHYTLLLLKHPGSLLVPYSLNKRALSRQNLKQYEAALADYKSLLDRYPEHPQAKSALLGMQETFTLAGTPEQFQEVLNSYKIKSPGDGSLEELEYETVKNTYLAERYSQAVVSISKFLTSYPLTVHRLELVYYLAESHYTLRSYAEAQTHYEQLVQSGKNPYLNKSLSKMADLTFSDKNYAKAVVYYQMLSKVAEARKESSVAYMGLSQCFFQLAQYDSCLLALDQLFKLGQLSQSQELNSKLLGAKASLALKEETKAVDYLLDVINSSKDERSAEAAYLLAEMDYLSGKPEKALEALYKFPSRYNQYEYWLGKAFLLISDCFVATQDEPQAIATLQSIVENSEDKTIVEEAKSRLTKLTEPKEKEKSNE
jgi:tetratricopeptide (TPR) repeat protein